MDTITLSKKTLCSIVIFLSVSTLHGMDSVCITSQQKDDLDRINRGFNDGMMQFGLGNKKVAEAILAGSYFYGKEHSLLEYIYPGQLTAASSLLYDINYQKGYLATAAECAISPTKKGLTYKHMAQQAHAEEKFDLEKEYYAKAFDFFGQSYKTDPEARKQYEDALWCGRGYNYNPNIIQNYYLSRLQDASDMLSGYLDSKKYGLSKKLVNQTLSKLSKLAQDDPNTQCTLARIYLGNRCGIKPNHEKTIALCKSALCSLAVMPAGQPLSEYNDLPAIIGELQKNSDLDIQRQALILQKYWSILSAIKEKNSMRLDILANLRSDDTTFASLALQLLHSRVNADIAQRLENITFKDETADAQAFREFCQSEDGKFAARILEWMLPEISPKPEIKDLFHLMLAGYAYHRNKYDAAITQFKQCSAYEKNRYWQALTIQMDTNTTSRKKKIDSLFPLLHDAFTIQSENEKMDATKKIIKDIFFSQYSGINDEQKEQCVTINRNFLDGMQEYHKGNTNRADELLLQAYSYAENNNLIHSLDPLLIQTVRKHISATQCAQKKYHSALAFTDDATDKADLYCHLAKQAYAQGNFAFGQQCYKNIFCLQKDVIPAIDKFAEYSHLAEKYANEPVSYHLSLMYAQDALISLAKEPFNQKEIRTYETLDTTLTILQDTHIAQHIREKALTIEKYFNILTATKMSCVKLVKSLCEPYKDDSTIQAAVMQLLGASIDGALRDNVIKNIPFDHPQLTQFYNAKGNIAITILQRFLADKKLMPEVEDLFHFIIGGYEYNNNNFDAAIAEIQLCNTYAKDLYLQALTIQMDTNAVSRTEKIRSILPLLHNAFITSLENEKTDIAKKIIAEACGYDASAPVEDTLSLCERWIPHFAIFTYNTFPLEYVHVLMSLNDLKKRMNLSPEQRKIVIQLNTYLDFFSLLQANDQKGLDILFSKKNTHLKGIRRILLEAIRGTKKNDIQNIILDGKAFEKFCDSDSVLLKIIEHIAKNPQERFKIKPSQCYFVLGGLASIRQDDSAARDYFSRCDQNDLYVCAKLLESTPTSDMLAVLRPCIPLLNHAQENSKTHIAKTIIGDIVTGSYETYLSLLLEKKEYEQAYAFAYCLTQLGTLIPSHIVFYAFNGIEGCLVKESYDQYNTLLYIPDRICTYNIIKEKADQKDIAACNSITFILNEHIKCPHHNAHDRINLERQCLDYLAYSLEYDKGSDESKQIKHSAYGILACKFGIAQKSISLLDEAIKYGNSQALYEKAAILTQQQPTPSEDVLTITQLLEQHILSKDDDIRRAQSYKSLGEYYYEKKELEHQKKAFDCLKAAADLGNYNAGHLLALLYNNGIKGYQAPDKEQTLICLEKTIDLNQESSYIDALHLRASIYYKDNQYAQAHEDLVHVLASEKYSESQKLFAHWNMGLTKLHLNEHEDLSEDIISHLRKAYEAGVTHQLANPDSSFINEFMLCSDQKTLNTVQQNINRIISNEKTDAISLDFCMVMGAVLFEQCKTQPITDALRQLAVSSLVYAAQKGNACAPLLLLKTSNKEVDSCDKIYYLQALRFNKPNSAKDIDPHLTKMYPENVIHQSLLLKRFSEKNNDPVLKKCASHIYENRSPIIDADPISYDKLPYEQVEQLIKECMSISSLVQAADAFMKNPAKSTPDEHYIALWYGSLIAYALDQKLLLKGAAYLEKSRQCFPGIQKEHVEKNLGYIYYKLGWQQHKSNNLELALGYLKKGTLLGNARCCQLFKEISDKQINQDETHKKLLFESNQDLIKLHERYDKIINNKNYHNLVSTLTDTLENEEKIHEEATDLIKKGFSCRDYFTLCENPIICFQFALDNYQKTENNVAVQKAIQKALRNSLNTDGKFTMRSTLEKLCTNIKNIIEKNNTQQMTLLLKTIKQELINHKVNIKAFEELYKDICNANLAQNRHWKK